jgi:sarcosine oxidase subunit beta
MSILDADVVVIGAGIIGASCAYHVAERGRRVVVVEAMEAPCMGSTARSNACIRGQWREEINISLCWYSIQQYRDFARIFGTDVGYRPIGYLILHSPEQWDAQLRAVDLQRSVGVPVEVLSPAQAQQLVAFETDGVAGATLGTADGRIDPHIATHAFLGHARERGTHVLLSSPVRSITRIGDRWHVHSDKADVAGDVVVNAAGGWSGEVAALAGLTVPVWHSRRMLFSTSAGQRTDLPMTIDAPSGFFIRSEGDRLIMGFGGEHEPKAYNNTLDWTWLEKVMEAGHERFPWILELPMDQRASWAGTYDISPDHLPFVGRMPGVDGWVNACGFSGHGVMQAPAVGRAVAEEIADGSAHTIDVDRIRIERLTSGAIIQRDLVL